jgi:hypothetical protein
LTLPTSGTNLLADNGSGALTIQTINSGSGNALTLQSNSTTALTIDTSQNVGIGTTSPNYVMQLYKAGAVANYLQVTSGATGAASGNGTLFGVDASGNGIVTVQGSVNYITSVAGAERMRINSSGALLVGTTSGIGVGSLVAFSGGGNVLHLQSSSSGANNFVSYSNGGTATFYVGNNGAVSSNIGSSATASYTSSYTGSGGSSIGYRADYGSATGTGYSMFFTYNGTGCGSITVTSGATAYNTSSDYRLKENVQPLTLGLATIAALKPVTYDWIANKEKGEGFIAHELAEIVPLAVVGEKDAVDEEGKIKPQGVDLSKIVVHLVAAIQEQQALITAQAADIAALKAKVGV